MTIHRSAYWRLIVVAGAALASLAPLSAPLASAATIASPNAALSRGLAGYWTMNGSDINWNTKTMRDQSGFSNTAAIGTIATTSVIAGALGQAIQFDGLTNYAVLGSAVSQAGPMTVSAWIKPVRVSGITMQIVDNVGDGGSQNYTFELNRTAGKLSTVWGDTIVLTGNSTLTAGRWYHVVMTRSGSSGNWRATFYVNGNQDGTATTAVDPVAVGTCGGGVNTYVGGLCNGASDPGPNTHLFAGAIDDVRIYNRALSSQEITQLYKLGSANIAHSNESPLSRGLVGYWTFDGPTINWSTGLVLDASGQGNTGSLIGMSTSTSLSSGKIGQALVFNGSSQYVDGTNVADNLTNMTVSAWVKTKSTGTSEAIVTKLGSGGLSSGNGWYLGTVLVGTPGAPLFFLQNNSGGNWVGRHGNATISDGKWHHLIGVCVNCNSTSATTTFYIDGKANASSDDNPGGTLAAGGISNASHVRIANDYDSELFAGSIDDVRIYNRALTSSEVAQLYALGTANVAHTNTSLVPLGLAAHWTFDGPTINWSTGIVLDASGQGNTGSLIGMSTSTSPVAGKIGQALYFNGSNSTVDNAVTTIPVFGYNTAYAVAMWVKGVANQSDKTLYYEGNGTHTHFSLGTDPALSGKLALWMTNQADTILLNDVLSTKVVFDNRWHHVAWVDNGGQAQLYIDGTRDATNFNYTRAGSTFVPSQSTIGSSLGANPFKGSIDDLRLYTRALSAQEVAQLYAAGK